MPLTLLLSSTSGHFLLLPLSQNIISSNRNKEVTQITTEAGNRTESECEFNQSWSPWIQSPKIQIDGERGGKQRLIHENWFTNETRVDRRRTGNRQKEEVESETRAGELHNQTRDTYESVSVHSGCWQSRPHEDEQSRPHAFYRRVAWIKITDMKNTWETGKPEAGQRTAGERGGTGQQLLWCRVSRTSEMFTFGSRAAAVEDESRAVLSSPPSSHSASVLSIIHHVVQMNFTRSQRAHVQNLQNTTWEVIVTFVRRVVSLHQGQLWMTGITQLIKTKKEK